MNVAGKELCEELYELSGWEDEWRLVPDKMSRLGFKRVPAYSLGYLLRKLPLRVEIRHELPASDAVTYWAAHYFQGSIKPYEFYSGMSLEGPEDAACRLAIELFKGGILTREEPQRGNRWTLSVTGNCDQCLITSTGEYIGAIKLSSDIDSIQDTLTSTVVRDMRDCGCTHEINRFIYSGGPLITRLVPKAQKEGSQQ